MPALHLKKNREKSLLQGHPWIFSGAIASIDESLTDGDIAAVIDYAGNHHGYGYYNGKTAITVRMLSFSEELVTDGLLRGLIASALDKRTNNPLLAGRDACRLLFSEGDFLPGLIVDRYGGHLVMQILTLGMEKLKENIVRLLEDLLHPESIYERSDHEGRRIEGLAPATGQVRGETRLKYTSPKRGFHSRWMFFAVRRRASFSTSATTECWCGRLRRAGRR